MRQQIGVSALLTSMCILAGGCTNVITGTPIAADKAGPVHQTPIQVSALEALLLDVSQVNIQLGATSMKVWYSAKAMWDWSKNVPEKNCLAIDGPAQEHVYSGTGWTAMRGQRLDDSVDDSKTRSHYAIQAIVAFPAAHEASKFYNNSIQSWSACSNRRFSDVDPNQPDTSWTVAGIINNSGTLSTALIQEGGDGWACQRALTARNNIAIDVVTCAYSQPARAAVDIAEQIAAKATKQ